MDNSKRDTIKYFGYGSNMHHNRIKQRVPSVRFIEPAMLVGYDLRYHKESMDGSRKCDAYYTGNQSDIVHGGIFELDADEIQFLDQAEGLGFAYDKKRVDLVNYKNKKEAAFLYYAMSHVDGMVPYDWYHAFVLEGAKQCGLADEYIEMLGRVKTKPDMNELRARDNRGVLNG